MNDIVIPAGTTLKNAERLYVEMVLAQCSKKYVAAMILDISEAALYRRLKIYRQEKHDVDVTS